jgi:hypothetical protein
MGIGHVDASHFSSLYLLIIKKISRKNGELCAKYREHVSSLKVSQSVSQETAQCRYQLENIWNEAPQHQKKYRRKQA